MSLRDRLQATKQIWEEARKAAIEVLNASYDERHGSSGDDTYGYLNDEMVGIQIEEGYNPQGSGSCDKIFLKLNGGPDLKDISVKDDFPDEVCEKLLDIGFDEVTIETMDGVDLDFFNTHRAAPKKAEGNS